MMPYEPHDAPDPMTRDLVALLLLVGGLVVALTILFVT